MSASKSIVHKLTPSQEGAYSDMKAIIESGEELATAYFADNDLIACLLYTSARRSDSSGMPWCHLALPSIKEMPRPFTVRAMTTLGLPLVLSLIHI